MSIEIPSDLRMTIIPSDFAVYVYGNCKAPLDLNECGIPNNIHALQWYGYRGWLEFKDIDNDPFTPIPPNEDIYFLPDWAKNCYQVWLDSQ